MLKKNGNLMVGEIGENRGKIAMMSCFSTVRNQACIGSDELRELDLQNSGALTIIHEM